MHCPKCDHSSIVFSTEVFKFVCVSCGHAFDKEGIPGFDRTKTATTALRPETPAINRPALAPIAPGDVVRLKSGGPEMTVEQVRGGILYCTWFLDNLQLITWAFIAEALTKVRGK